MKANLVLFARDVNHGGADPAADHGHPTCQSSVGRRELIRSNRRHCGGGGGASIYSIQLHRCSIVRAKQGLSLHIIRHV